MKYTSALLLVIMVLTSFVSCKKEDRPEGLPDLYPISVKIIQDGAPLANANVTLLSSDPQLMRWPCGGCTDEQGVAKLNTYGFDGAPAGKFKVMVCKSETEGGAQTAEEAVQMMKDGVGSSEKTFDLIDPQYKNDSTTPLSLEVLAQSENPTAEFDVGASVRSEVKL